MVSVKEIKSWFLDPKGCNLEVIKDTYYNSFVVLYDDAYALNKKVLWVIGDSDGATYVKLEHNNEDVYLLLRKRWRK